MDVSIAKEITGYGSLFFFGLNLIRNSEKIIIGSIGISNLKLAVPVVVLYFFIGIFFITVANPLISLLEERYSQLEYKYIDKVDKFASITKNGLWIKDTNIDGVTSIIHSTKIDGENLTNNFITQFDENFKVIRYINSNKIDIRNNNWIIHNAEIYKDGSSFKENLFEMNSNFNYQTIQSLFSNLSSLSFVELIELKKNYKLLNYSTTEVSLQIQKIFSYPFYLLLMTILSSIIMYNTKTFKSNTLKISLGLFLSVLIYYINNFFLVMGKTEKISIEISVWVPILILLLINLSFTYRINEK